MVARPPGRGIRCARASLRCTGFMAARPRSPFLGATTGSPFHFGATRTDRAQPERAPRASQSRAPGIRSPSRARARRAPRLALPAEAPILHKTHRHRQGKAKACARSGGARIRQAAWQPTSEDAEALLTGQARRLNRTAPVADRRKRKDRRGGKSQSRGKPTEGGSFRLEVRSK